MNTEPDAATPREETSRRTFLAATSASQSLTGSNDVRITARTIVTLVVWAVIPGLRWVSGAELPSGWKAGVARVNITPTTPVRMAGYASRTSPSRGVAHQLFGKALALAGPNGHKVVIVTCDIIALRRNLSERVARRV